MKKYYIYTGTKTKLKELGFVQGIGMFWNSQLRLIKETMHKKYYIRVRDYFNSIIIEICDKTSGLHSPTFTLGKNELKYIQDLIERELYQTGRIYIQNLVAQPLTSKLNTSCRCICRTCSSDRIKCQWHIQ